HRRAEAGDHQAVNNRLRTEREAVGRGLAIARRLAIDLDVVQQRLGEQLHVGEPRFEVHAQQAVDLDVAVVLDQQAQVEEVREPRLERAGGTRGDLTFPEPQGRGPDGATEQTRYDDGTVVQGAGATGPVGRLGSGSR